MGRGWEKERNDGKEREWRKRTERDEDGEVTRLEETQGESMAGREEERVKGGGIMREK